MTPVFIDTFYFLALVNPADKAHKRAVAVSKTNPSPLLTTAWVLTELGDALALENGRRRFIQIIRDLRADPLITIVPATEDHFEAGLALFAARPDKGWSLTDCISFAVMKEHGIRDALTGDRHFEQAGFRPLLRG